MNFNAAELAALESGVVRIGVFFRLDTQPDPVRLWLGIGAIEPGVNVLDASGARYLGFGDIQDVPNFKQMINGAAERVEFTISGVSGAILQIASGGDAGAVKGRDVHVGIAIMGSDWQLLGPVHWTANYVADYMSINQQVTDSADALTVRTISLSCGSVFTARRRPQFSYFSNRDQLARSPGDRFCERTAVYANQFNKAWPTFPS